MKGKGPSGLSVALVVGLCALCACAASSINVALRASFNSAPYLVELLETAAQENSSAYFPLLDRIADGAFDEATTDKELYERFLQVVQDDGHITDAEGLSSFQFALAIHSAAPRVEAHFQYYNTSVQTLLSGAEEGCENWVHFNGKRYCSPDLAAPSEAAVRDGILDLPFDRILGDTGSGTPSVVYADITSKDFRKFHKTISLTAKSGKTTYRVRYRPSPPHTAEPLAVSGYGVELALKRTDYIVIDDREAGEVISKVEERTSASTLLDEDVADLKPLSSSELLKLDMKAASFVMNSADPLETLLKLTGDFPKHSAAIAATNISDGFRNEHVANREVFLPHGYNVIWINGVQVLARDFDGFALLERLRHERELINGAKGLGLTGEDAISFLSHEAVSSAFADQEPQRYDWRDEIEGGNAIMWLNDIEKDSRYDSWPSSIRALLQRTYPGQLPPVKKEVHNLILPIDFSDYKDVELVVENVQSFVKRQVPVRFGLVPITQTDAAREQAKVMYHLFDTYGLAAGLGYLEKGLKGLGRKLSGPSQSYFDQAIKDRHVRKDRAASPLENVLQSRDIDEHITAARKYLARLVAADEAAPFFANGIAIPRTDEWLQAMSNRLSVDSRAIQQAVFYEQFTEDSYLPDLFLTGSSPRRNPLVIPEEDKDAKHINLAAIPGVAEGFIGSVPSLHAENDTVESELVHLVLIADLNTELGEQLSLDVMAFQKDHDNIEVFRLHNPGATAPPELADPPYSDLLSVLLERDPSAECGTGAGGDARQFWASAKPLLEASGIGAGQAGILLNGRVVGPIPSHSAFQKDDLETLLAYERRKRLVATAAAIKELGLSDKAATPLAFAKLSNLIALSTVSDVPEGIFDAAPTRRVSIFNDWNTTYTAIETGDIRTATVQVVASIDPATELAQRWVPILKVLSELSGVHMRLFLNPRDRLEDLPVKRFYRHVLASKPSFDANGALESQQARFTGLPADALLTMAMDTPPSWLVAPSECVHDLDNIKLSSLKGKDIDAVYELEHILIEGHSRDITVGPPPRGAQLVLGTEGDPHIADTIIMANLGYFQFKANPGFYNLTLQKGRSEEIFHIDSAGSKGYNAQPGDETTEIALTSFRGLTLFPRVSRNPGMEEEEVLEGHRSAVDELAAKTDKVLSKVGLGGVKTGDVLSKAQKLGSKLFDGKGTDLQALPHADINIFSVASGHLYERMLNIMMVSVMKHTTHTVKFWFIEQFLSPSFKAFLPTLAEEYGFRYEMVTYKWPHWLRAQKEKQREIWGYKILFLDVLFPLDLDKVIFVDADQIVRTDMYELVSHDLKGAPYGFTPMCDSRTEMEGFRFWKQGYWKNFLRGLPYHISALYVVDLARFRQMAAGDRLRQQYHQLSADPASLSNLDQDLPNHMQHMLPIHSLPQEWLWCETWCSDESLAAARTIDLCNNPLTKEPKLERARRQVPEWTIYDDEIAAVAKRKSAEGTGVAAGAPIAGDARDTGAQAEAQVEDAEKRKAEAKRERDEL